MGGNSSVNSSNLKIDYSEWQQIGLQGNSRILSSTRGAGQGQQQVVIMDPKSTIDKQLQIYNYRKHQASQGKGLVSVHGVDVMESKSTSMCGSEQGIKVITERIPRRWTSLPQLTLPECLYSLNQALKGYRQCYDRTGAIYVTQQMIGITPNGEIRVWLNQNFAVNHPPFESPMLQTTGYDQHFKDMIGGTRDEEQMVRGVVDVIEERCEEGQYPHDLRERLHLCKTFVSAQTETQDYANRRKLWVPDRIHPNLELVMGRETRDVYEKRPVQAYRTTTTNVTTINPVKKSSMLFTYQSPSQNFAPHTATTNFGNVSTMGGNQISYGVDRKSQGFQLSRPAVTTTTNVITEVNRGPSYEYTSPRTNTVITTDNHYNVIQTSQVKPGYQSSYAYTSSANRIN